MNLISLYGSLLEHFGKGIFHLKYINRNILFPDCSKKDQIYVLDILTLFEYILRIQIQKIWENEENFDLPWTDLILCGIE